MAPISNHIMQYAYKAQLSLVKKIHGHRRLWVMGIAMLCFFSGKLYGQDQLDYAVHANIIYHFTKYVDWPLSKKNGDFIIGIAGDSPLYDELLKLVKNKKVGNQFIVVRRFSSSASVFNCHILFISDDASSKVKKIVNSTANSSVLLVSESDGLAELGSCINFMIVKEKLKLEINKANIENRGLNIASELLKLGTIIKKE